MCRPRIVDTLLGQVAGDRPGVVVLDGAKVVEHPSISAARGLHFEAVQECLLPAVSALAPMKAVAPHYGYARRTCRTPPIFARRSLDQVKPQSDGSESSDFVEFVATRRR